MDQALQALKDKARRVAEQERKIAADDRAAWWQMLLDVAERDLAAVWEYVDKEMPASFTAQTMEAAFCIRIPGHHTIFAAFHGRDFNGPCWWRNRWLAGSTFRDGELPNWMVGYNDKNRYMTYHHTLGAAMLAAEIK